MTIAFARESWGSILFRFRRWFQQRCHTCPDCGAEIDGNFKALKKSGHHRGRVFYARLALERLVVELHSRLPEEAHSRHSSVSDKIHTLRLYGVLPENETRRFRKHSANASKVIHGGPCDVGRATQIVNAINHLIWETQQRNARKDEAAAVELETVST